MIEQRLEGKWKCTTHIQGQGTPSISFASHDVTYLHRGDPGRQHKEPTKKLRKDERYHARVGRGRCPRATNGHRSTGPQAGYSAQAQNQPSTSSKTKQNSMTTAEGGAGVREEHEQLRQCGREIRSPLCRRSGFTSAGGKDGRTWSVPFGATLPSPLAQTV